MYQAGPPSADENTPTRNYNYGACARVEEGEGLVSRLLWTTFVRSQPVETTAYTYSKKATLNASSPSWSPTEGRPGTVINARAGLCSESWPVTPSRSGEETTARPRGLRSFLSRGTEGETCTIETILVSTVLVCALTAWFINPQLNHLLVVYVSCEYLYGALRMTSHSTKD